MDAPDRDRVEIDAFETPDVDRPHPRIGAGATERLNPAGRTEIVPRGMGMECVQRQVLDWGEQLEAFRVHSMIQSAASPTYRTIAYPNMIQIGDHLEFDPAAMAGTSISILHCSAVSPPTAAAQAVSRCHTRRLPPPKPKRRLFDHPATAIPCTSTSISGRARPATVISALAG